MRKEVLALTFMLMLGLALAAMVTVAATDVATAQGGNIYQATLVEPNQKTPEVSTEEVRRILADGSAIVLDTRDRTQFVAGHIPGARIVDAPPSESVAAVERLVSGGKNKPLVLYCNGPFCQASRQLSEQLVGAGFANVRRYQLGIPIWRVTRRADRDQLEVYPDFQGRPDGRIFRCSVPRRILEGKSSGGPQRAGQTNSHRAGYRKRLLDYCQRRTLTHASCCSDAILVKRVPSPTRSVRALGTMYVFPRNLRDGQDSDQVRELREPRCPSNKGRYVATPNSLG